MFFSGITTHLHTCNTLIGYNLCEYPQGITVTVEAKVRFFDNIAHRSLAFKNGETPEEAFWRKLPEEMMLKYEGR